MILKEQIIIAKLSPGFNSNFSWGWVGYIISFSSQPPDHPEKYEIATLKQIV